MMFDGNNVVIRSKYRDETKYKDKNILAPMVRIGTLPTRLLALDYGADLVYGEEIIDYKMLSCTKVENVLLGTTDFVTKDGIVTFRTCPAEKAKLVFQMGTSDAKRALKVGKMLEPYISALDINMGCPKKFSIDGGMGAALLTKPEKIYDILTTLINGLTIPVTCKIRIFPDLKDTIKLVKHIETTGVSAIGIHGRTRDERPRDNNHNDVINEITKIAKIPVIANGGSGDISCYDDIQKFREVTGATSVMVARAAQWNPSIFRREGTLKSEDVIKDYIKYAVDFDNCVSNSKYCLQQLNNGNMETPAGIALKAASSLKEISAVWGLEEYYNQAYNLRQSRAVEISSKRTSDDAGLLGGPLKKRKDENGTEHYEYFIRFNRRDYSTNFTPKQFLHEYTKQNKIPPPVYKTIESEQDRLYQSIVTVDGKQYQSTYWDKAKKWSEQASAVLCCLILGIDDGRKETAEPIKLTILNE